MKRHHSQGKQFQYANISTQNFQLEQIIGMTVSSSHQIDVNLKTNEIAYTAGSTVVIYSPSSNRQIKYFTAKAQIFALKFSLDGTLLFAGEGACKLPAINIWDLSNSNLILSMRGHKQYQYAIAQLLQSPTLNYNYLVSLGSAPDKGLFVWDFKSGKKETVNKLSKHVHCVAFDDTGTLMASAGVQHLKLWYFKEDGQVIKQKSDKDDIFIIEPKSMFLNENFQDKIFVDIKIYEKSKIFTITQDSQLCLFNESSRQLDRWMDLKASQSFSLALYQTYLVCASSDSIVRIFSTQNFKHITTLHKPPSLGNYNIEKGVTKLKSASPDDIYADCVGIQVDPYNNLLFAIYSDRTFFIWDIKAFNKVSVKRSFLNHSGPIYDLQVLPLQSSEEVTFFVTASADKTIRIWHFSEDLQLQATVDISQIIGIRRNVYCKNLSKIIYISEEKKHFKTNQEEEINEDQVKCVKISKDGNYIACGDVQGFLRVYSTSTFQKEYELQGHDSEILTLDFTPQNDLCLDLLASGSRDRQIKIYDVQMQFAVILTLDEHTSSITSVKFGYIQKKLILISCSLDRSIIFRELNGTKFVIYHQEQISKIFCMELSHNQEILYVGLERKVNLYDTLTGKFKQAKDWQKYENHKITLDCSGSYLACQNEDKVLRIRESQSNLIVGSLNQYVSGMAYALSNKHFFTSGFDGCIYIWKISQEVKNQIDKRKGQLGLMGKRLKEVLQTSKEWTIDSFWIEEELRNFLNKNEENKNITEEIDDTKEELIQFDDDEPPLEIQNVEKVLKPISLKMLPKQQVKEEIHQTKSLSQEPFSGQKEEQLQVRGSAERQNKFADFEQIKQQMQLVENNISVNIKNFEDNKKPSSKSPSQQILKINKDKLQVIDRESLILRQSNSDNLEVIENSQLFKSPDLKSEIKSELFVNQSLISQQFDQLVTDKKSDVSDYKELSEFQQKESKNTQQQENENEQEEKQIKSFEEYKEKQQQESKQVDDQKREEQGNLINEDLETTQQIKEKLQKVEQIKITFNPIEQQKQSVDDYPVTRESVNLNQSLPQDKPFEYFSQFINKDQTEMSIIEESRLVSENKLEKMQRLKSNSLKYSNLIQCHIKTIMNEMEGMQKVLQEIENNDDYELRNEVRKNVETDLNIMQQSMEVVNQKSRVCLKPTQFFGRTESQFQPSQTGQSQILNENDISMESDINKVIEKMIMDCSKDIFENYSQMLVQQIKSQIK